MSGKLILPIVFLLLCLTVSACTIQAHLPSSPDVLGSTPSPGDSVSPEPQATGYDEILEFRQKTPYLPDIQTLSSFPGVLESISLTLEEIVTVLGTQFDLEENKAQGYDTYHYPQYQLSFDFDKVSKKLSTVYLDGVPYYVYSSAIKALDLNGDGMPEKIVAFENQVFLGTLLIVDGATGKTTAATLDYFNNYCEIEVLTDFGNQKECLILLRTRGGRKAEIFSYRDGELISVLPDNLDALIQGSLVSLEGQTAVWVNNSANILYLCPLPQRITEGLGQWTNAEAHRYQVSLEPQISERGLELKVETSLEVKLSDNYNFMEGSEGIYCDVARVVETYVYEGQGQWQKEKTEGGPKYQEGVKTAPTLEDLSIAGFKLYDSYETIAPAFADLSQYSDEELYAGVLIEKEGVRVGISQNMISYLSLEEGAVEATAKGLKLLDSREMVISQYGLPDQGFLDDATWTYYVIGDNSDDNPALFFNTLNLEFDGDKVCRIWISSYVTAY